MKHLELIAAVTVLTCVICVAWTRDNVPPDPGGPELMQDCWGIRPSKACAMCHKVPATSTCGGSPCDDKVVTNQDGHEAYRVETGGNHGRVDGDETAGPMCKVEEYVCTGGQCVRKGPVWQQYGVNTAPLGTPCKAGTEPQ